MKKLICCIMLLAFLGLAHAGPVSALQNGEDHDGGGGMGAIIEWIHKLSGPPFLGGGVAPFWESGDRGHRIRLTLTYRGSRDESSAGLSNDDAHFNMFSVQVTPEFQLGNWGSVGAGVTANIFGGDTDTFLQLSFPLQFQLRPENDDDFIPRAGVGLKLFPPFADDEFLFRGGPRVDVSRDSWETVFHLFGGVDYRKR